MVRRVRYHFYMLEMTEHILPENRMRRLLANASQLASLCNPVKGTPPSCNRLKEYLPLTED